MQDMEEIEESSIISKTGKGIAIFLVFYIVLVLLLMFILDNEPDQFDVEFVAKQRAGKDIELVTGYITTSTLITAMETVLNKPGGYLSNDIMPPGVIMDNIPNWKLGVITQEQEVERAFPNDFSRSQTQSTEDKDFMIADPQFHFDTGSWILPATEGEYQTGLSALENYLHHLSESSDRDAQFFSRADNLRDWLAIVEKRLGSLSQRLSASVGQDRVNTDLQGDTAATQSTDKPQLISVKTPWLEIDDVFYESRGSTWALIHFMQAIEIDFDEVLRKKNALVSLRQIIRELEATQHFVWSPIILNGTGFGLLANHSLVMASYVSRANAAVIDLRNLLEQG